MSQLANAIRFLSVDAVQKANSGHPGAPMGMAEMAEVLWTKFLNHNPANPKFYNRDRFVLSNGHASMILYSLLHLTGYNVSIDDLKNFRQLHSKTPGHPEYGYTDGVETTTGPLGQGIANAVGMALAEKILAAEFNKDGLNIVDHHTYVFMGDGCMMEGVSHEACSLAGTLGLGKLIVLYDDNNISIDGKVDGWFTENIPQRFESYGWHVIPNVNGHDTDAIQTAIEAAKAETGKPSLICCKTLIGKGSANKEGSHKTHGAPLGADEIEATRKHLGWAYPAFEIPQEIYAAWDAKEKGAKLEAEWNELFTQYQAKYPAEAAEFARRMDKKLPENFDAYVQAALKEVCAGGTGGNHAVAGAAVAFEDGYVAGNQVNQRAWDKERIDFARAAFDNGFAGGFDAGQAADARADVHADTVFVEVFRVVQAGIADGLQRGGDAVVDEHVHAAGFFAADVLADVEIAHFAGDLAVNVGCVETGDEADAAFAGQ